MVVIFSHQEYLKSGDCSASRVGEGAGGSLKVHNRYGHP